MAISAADVKNLKDLTNCGMMDCKRALEETGGDVDAAIKYLREKGLAKAAKKSGRIAAEGLVFAKVDEGKKQGVLVEVNSETDFAARTDRFVEFVELVADTLLNNDVSTVDELKEIKVGDEKLGDILTERIATIGENIQIRRFAKLSGNLHSYIHNNGGSIIGSLIKYEADAVTDAVKDAAKKLLLQITAYAPRFVSKDEISQQVLDEERDIQLNIAKEENAQSAKPKPDAVLEKIVEGRMSKFAAEIALLEQQFVSQPDITVGAFVKSVGNGFRPVSFVRFEKGEGIEKKEDDFAAEVAAMAGGGA